MSLSEMRRHFASYGSGQLQEMELRTMIRSALSREPQLGEEFTALTDACRRANFIGPELQSDINADIREMTSPKFDLTRVRTPWPDRVEPASFDIEHAANSAEEPFISDPEIGYSSQPAGDADRSASSTSRPVRTGSNSTGSWDLTDGLNEVGAPLYPGAVLRERFVLVEELGHGGMGVVYKAFDRSRGDMKDRYVAIKVLSEEFKRHPLAVKSLQREARKAQRLAHPNIVAVHDFDRDGGNVYMVMELLSGRSLDQVLREDGQGGIPMGPASEIIRSLASALSYSHEHEIIHCDFKPSNAFLGRDGRVKVLDFGIARAAPSTNPDKADSTLFDAGQLGAVSQAYASFELLQGESPSVRDDVYSFACVVYELLSGVHPYQRIDAVKAFHSGLEPRPIRKLSRTQWRALKQGLSFRGADRSPSIDSLAHQLLSPKPKTRMWIASSACAAAAAVVVGGFVWKGAEIQQRASTWLSYAHWHRVNPAPVVARTPANGSAHQDAGFSTSGPRKATPIETTTEAVAASSAEKATAQTPLPPDASAHPSPLVATSSSSTSSSSVQTEAANVRRTSVGSQVGERTHVRVEILKEQFENQSIAGDVEAASKTAAEVVRASPGSPYATVEIPRIIVVAYQRRAKSQLLAGQVAEALQTIADGRRKYGRSAELRDQEVTYVAVSDLFDRLRTAIVMNPITTQQLLDELKGMQGADFEATDQMLAQTLADRIADQRAAGRASLADKLEETGQQVFPKYSGLLGRGQAARLSSAPIEVNPQ